MEMPPPSAHLLLQTFVDAVPPARRSLHTHATLHGGVRYGASSAAPQVRSGDVAGLRISVAFIISLHSVTMSYTGSPERSRTSFAAGGKPQHSNKIALRSRYASRSFRHAF